MWFVDCTASLFSLEYYLKKWPVLVFFCFFSIKLYRKTKNQVLVNWPLLKVLPSIIQNAHRAYDWTVDLSNTYGGTIAGEGPVFGNVKIILTCDPRNVKYILTKISNFIKGSNFGESFDILGEGLVNADSHFWVAQRRIARMAFSSKNVRNIIVDVGQKVVKESLLPLLAHVAKQSYSVVDLEDVFLRYAYDASVGIIFGKNPNYLSTSFPPNEFAKATDDALEAIFYRHVMPSSWWKLCRRLMIGSTERKMEKASRIIDQHLTEYITAKRDDMARGGVVEGSDDLLQVYMGLKEGEKDELLLSKMSGDKFFRDTALTFLVAGRDTTASALSWFFWLVSKNPRVEAKIVEELKLIISNNRKGENGERTSIFDADDVTGMVYLHAALCESLRLYPSVPLIHKDTKEDDVLPDGTVVKSGTMIIISCYAMGRMEWVWGKDCLEFKPERWIDKDGKLNNETMSKLISFGLGPRMCIGKDMAFVLMKLAASGILYNFHVEVLEGQNMQPAQSISLKMKNGLMVRIKERVLL